MEPAVMVTGLAAVEVVEMAVEMEAGMVAVVMALEAEAVVARETVEVALVRDLAQALAMMIPVPGLSRTACQAGPDMLPGLPSSSRSFRSRMRRGIVRRRVSSHVQLLGHLDHFSDRIARNEFVYPQSQRARMQLNGPHPRHVVREPISVETGGYRQAEALASEVRAGAELTRARDEIHRIF